MEAADGAKAPKTTKGETIPTPTFKAKHPVDCVRIYGNVLYAKTRDARIETFDLARGKRLRQWTLPNERYRGANVSYPGPACRFDCTSDGKFLACGDSCTSGVVYVYDTRTAELIAELQPLRVTGVVHAAARRPRASTSWPRTVPPSCGVTKSSPTPIHAPRSKCC